MWKLIRDKTFSVNFLTKRSGRIVYHGGSCIRKWLQGTSRSSVLSPLSVQQACCYAQAVLKTTTSIAILSTCNVYMIWSIVFLTIWKPIWGEIFVVVYVSENSGWYFCPRSTSTWKWWEHILECRHILSNRSRTYSMHNNADFVYVGQ